MVMGAPILNDKECKPCEIEVGGAALIIFVRNPVLGKVKTRLAATVGDEKALAIYQYLLDHTKKITEHLNCAKFIFYAGSIHENDLWNGYLKRLQKGHDLGEKMQHAFEELFNEKYKNICIIGSDCSELTQSIICEAFNSLQINETVIGPAADGGYYLLGMQHPMKKLFANKSWSTDTVYKDTLHDIEMNNYSVYTLPVLNDVDEEKDISIQITGLK